MISYWKNTKEVYFDDGLTLIIGWYYYKHMHNGGYKSLGIHWETYPKSRGILSPCVIPEDTRDSMLSGLLHKAIMEGDTSKIENLTLAIKFFC